MRDTMIWFVRFYHSIPLDGCEFWHRQCLSCDGLLKRHQSRLRLANWTAEMGLRYFVWLFFCERACHFLASFQNMTKTKVYIVKRRSFGSECMCMYFVSRYTSAPYVYIWRRKNVRETRFDRARGALHGLNRGLYSWVIWKFQRDKW